jgi:hypothetical protein
MHDTLFSMNGNYYRSDITGDIVEFSPHSGGFISTMDLSYFEDHCEITDTLPDETVFTWVTIEHDKPFKAHVNPLDTWNGWAQPMFDRDTIEQNKEYLFGSQHSVEAVNGGYNIVSNKGDAVEFCDYHKIEFEGKKITVNSLLSGWCWDVITCDRALIYLIANEDCYGYKKDTTADTYKAILRSVYPVDDMNAPLSQLEFRILAKAIDASKTI